MPIERRPVQRPGKKKKGGLRNTIFDIPGNFAEGAVRAGKGLPTAVFEQQRKSYRAARSGDPRKLVRAGIPGVAVGSDDLADFLRGSKATVRHPLRDPFQTLTLALALAGGAGGAFSRAGSFSKTMRSGKGFKAAMSEAGRKPIYTRYVKRPYNPSHVWALPANPNPLVRGARKLTLDPLYEKSFARRNTPTRAAARRAEKIKKQGGVRFTKKELEHIAKAKTPEMKKKLEDMYLARGNETQGRYAKFIINRIQEGRNRRAGNLENDPLDYIYQEPSLPRELLQFPTNLMRAGMYLRPRYYGQNLISTGLLLGARPLSTAVSLRKAMQLKKVDPELLEMVRAAGGETGMSSMAIGSSGRLSSGVRRMAHAASQPEARLRQLAMLTALRDEGIKNRFQIRNALENPRGARVQRAMERGGEEVVDYGRIGPRERRFMETGIPIFYPMYKNMARTAARFPTQHPIITALAAQQGNQGYQQQIEAFGGDPPPWSPYLIPLGDDKTLNPQNIYPFSPGLDVFRQATAGMNTPTLSLATLAGPSLEFLYGGVTGRDFASGFRLRNLPEDAKWWEKWVASGGESLMPSVPGKELISPRPTKAFGTDDFLTRLGLWGLGPAFTPRPTDFDVIQQQGEIKPRVGPGPSLLELLQLKDVTKKPGRKRKKKRHRANTGF